MLFESGYILREAHRMRVEGLTGWMRTARPRRHSLDDTDSVNRSARRIPEIRKHLSLLLEPHSNLFSLLLARSNQR